MHQDEGQIGPSTEALQGNLLDRHSRLDEVHPFDTNRECSQISSDFDQRNIRTGQSNMNHREPEFHLGDQFQRIQILKLVKSNGLTLSCSKTKPLKSTFWKFVNGLPFNLVNSSSNVEKDCSFWNIDDVVFKHIYSTYFHNSYLNMWNFLTSRCEWFCLPNMTIWSIPNQERMKEL